MILKRGLQQNLGPQTRSQPQQPRQQKATALGQENRNSWTVHVFTF
jgi:hypothetical protein